MTKKLVLLVVVSLLILSGIVWRLWMVPPDRLPSSTQETVVFDAKKGLKGLTWSQVGPMATAISGDRQHLLGAIALSEQETSPPSLYLRGLLLMVDNRPEPAMAAWDAIPLDQIPAHYLYPPYRLHSFLTPNEINRYRPPLRQAVEANAVTPLIQARFQSREGELSSALANYLLTDPAQWTSYDMENWGIMDGHQGLQSDLRHMLAAALKAGRVEKKLAQEVRQWLLLLANTTPSSQEALEGIRSVLLQNGAAAQLAREVVARQNQARSLFVTGQYDALLKAYRDATPADWSTEMIVLMFLAAIEVRDLHDSERWGQEIKRRFPQPQVGQWVLRQTIKVQP